MMKTALLLVTVVGCSSGDEPSNTPPPPWGVPITGGTMIVSRDNTAVVSDPDRDRVVMVDLATGAVVAEVALPNDEPGRLTEDAAGRIHVALRRGGGIVTFASARSGQILYRRATCPEPRGLAYEASTDLVHVACTGGELVSLPSSGGAAVRTVRLDRDLRDVIVSGSNLMVSRFRTPEVLTVNAQGTVANRAAPPNVQRFGSSGGDFGGGGLVPAIPTVAWRTIALPNNRLLVAHQRQVKGMLETDEGGYGGSCGGSPAETAFTLFEPGLPPVAVQPFASGALPVDIAVSPNGQQIAVATAGNGLVQVTPIGVINSRDMDQCGRGGFPGSPSTGGKSDELGRPTSVAYAPNNDLVIFYSEVPALVVRPGGIPTNARTIVLSGDIGYDAGRGLFHQQTASGLACASCHPEGREDGLVWEFAGFGRRRTQSLAGDILERGPYHWVGDMKDLGVLMDDVFANRMAGGKVNHSQKVSLGPWLNRIPAPAPVAAEPTAVERGREVFQVAQCASCHNGALFTNNTLVDVGTGGKFKVPSLVGIAARAPFMHSGCAATLKDRFNGTCGGGDKHGLTSTLTQAQTDDLVKYLESL
jgi:mono/diheme cytochrome c family protein